MTLGYLESALESYESAWSYLDPANPLTGTMPPGRPVVHVPESVEVLVALGRTGEARRLLQPFEERAQALNRVWATRRDRTLPQPDPRRGGDLEGAEEAAMQAIAITEANGWPLQLGRALLALRNGATARADGRARRAQRWSVPLQSLRRWGRRSGSSVHGTNCAESAVEALPPADGLSETETRIAELVAAGKTNNEVAQTLHLSRKTVEWNLSKIYRKLEVRSRTELAARFPEH